MSDERSRGLIDALVRDLAPVRPIPRLRSVAAVVTALSIAGAGLVLFAFGARPGVDALLVGAAPCAVAAGLAVAGFGAVIAALAHSVPGREAAARVGAAAAGLGLLVALGAAASFALSAPAPVEPAPLAAHVRCLTRALLAALPPILALAWFSGRALAHGPLAVALAAATGAAALGAVGMLAGCRLADPSHLFAGHATAPLIGALLLTLPVLTILRRLRTRL